MSKRKAVKSRDKQPKKRRKKARFRFLDLPGELRNHVYEYVVESEDVIRVAPQSSMSSSAHSRHQLTSIRALRGFGLTQVCRQIRKEFRPLWLEQTPLLILPEHIPRFLSDFVNGYGKHAAANVSFAYPKQKTLDILPCFKLARESSLVQFKPLSTEDFAYEWNTIASAVRQIVIERPWLGDRISKILVRAPSCLVFLFKRGHHKKCLEPWNDYELIRPWKIGPQKRLLKKYGLSKFGPCFYIDDGDK